MKTPRERLYELLPAVYRIRDAEQGGPLEQYLSVLAEQLAVLEEDVEQLYDDLFIETCSEWVVPYIGDLVGNRTLHGVVPKTLSRRAEVANTIAPEHLELSVENAQQLAKSIRHAGAIFLGRYTAEALGDYCAGPNHVLPTSRTARFSSPLGVYDFQKRSSLIGCSASGASELGKVASTLARGEGLVAHARSAENRIKN